ncbi:hypothetical protein [Nocardioides acrostichi]|uniref:DUF2567 domain-containing protein n=1 Tax=Nocardioides acrostichi TaxID=2784339 RepID=A0A930UTN5_9ACTN|nr:hypothetical protein [Nocardioides acrostichi]MBF4160638.1 hypothetical protein [Nocardioides acrostichi]
MPDELTSGRRRGSLGRSLLWGLLLLVLALAAGAALGVGWEHWWSPTSGTVVQHHWYVVDKDLNYDLDGLRNQFRGTARFVEIGLATGAVLGLLAAFSPARDALVTLFFLVLGSAGASVLMWQVGTRLGPPDPQIAASTAKDGTVLAGNLALGSPVALVVLPVAALLVYATVTILTLGRVETSGVGTLPAPSPTHGPPGHHLRETTPS